MKPLEPFYPASPSRPANYAVWFTNRETRAFILLTFYPLYGAKKAIDFVIDNASLHESKLGAEQFVLVAENYRKYGDIEIKSPQLDTIMGHKYSPLEQEFVLPDREAYILRQMMRKQDEEPATTPVAPAPAIKVAPETKAAPKPLPYNKGGLERVQKAALKAGTGLDECEAVVLELSRRIKSSGRIDMAALEKFAKAHGLWDDKYKTLPNPGLAMMAVTNKLKNRYKKGEKVVIKWN